ncbi:MAG: GNAT family N-acetyltransferase [Trueperaceae bacterium]
MTAAGPHDRSDQRPTEVGSTRAYQAAKLRWAVETDAPALLELWRAAHHEDDASDDAWHEELADMRGWLEHGGAILLEDPDGAPLCAVRWRFLDRGWLVDTVATRPEAREQGFGRWLMTKLEALAIKRNVPTLTVAVHDPARLPYYHRLGYREVEADDAARLQRASLVADVEAATVLAKRVGGTWQRQPGSAAPRSVA